MGYGFMTNWNTQSESFFLAGHSTYLVDAGYGANGAQRIKHTGIGIDYLVVTHGDRDHIGLAETAFTALTPKVVVVAPMVRAEESLRLAIREHLYGSGPRGPGTPAPGGAEAAGEPPSPPAFRTFLPRELLRPGPDGPYRLDGSWQDSGGESPGPSGASPRQSNPIEFPVFVRRDLGPYGQALAGRPPGATLPEFATYCTSEQLRWSQDVLTWAHALQFGGSSGFRTAMSVSKWMWDVLPGSIKSAKGAFGANEFAEVCSLLRRRVRNQRSLICRVGEVILTGDATANQLTEVTARIHGAATLLTKAGARITAKINHHGSPKADYLLPSFYAGLQPSQLLLSRHFRVRGGDGLKQITQTCAQVTRVVDSGGLTRGQGVSFRW